MRRVSNSRFSTTAQDRRDRKAWAPPERGDDRVGRGFALASSFFSFEGVGFGDGFGVGLGLATGFGVALAAGRGADWAAGLDRATDFFVGVGDGRLLRSIDRRASARLAAVERASAAACRWASKPGRGAADFADGFRDAGREVDAVW